MLHEFPVIFQSSSNYTIPTEIYSCLHRFVSLHLFRSLSPPSASANPAPDALQRCVKEPSNLTPLDQIVFVDNDNDEEHPFCEPTWPHLEKVYRILFLFLELSSFEAATAREHGFDRTFVHELVQLFASEDSRERKVLGTVFHRFYKKFHFLRKEMRHAMYEYLGKFVFDDSSRNEYAGISEILVVFSCIINGYNTPLKSKHLEFFEKLLISLYSSPHLLAYYQPLSLCVHTFIMKQTSL